MTPVLQIRAMRMTDLPAVLEIQAACYAGQLPESAVSLGAKCAASPATCFVAEAAGTPAAYLIALPWVFASPPALNAAECELPALPDCLYLHDLAVAPGARKLGAGAALVAVFFAQLERLALRRASLIAVQDSAPYWRRHGFGPVVPAEPLSARLASYGAGIVYMERDDKKRA